MAMNVAQKLIDSHLVEGRPEPGSGIGIRVDQTLTQDATGTMVMLELEAMGLDRVRTELSAQYVDHNLLQATCSTSRASTTRCAGPRKCRRASDRTAPRSRLLTRSRHARSTCSSPAG